MADVTFASIGAAACAAAVSLLPVSDPDPLFRGLFRLTIFGVAALLAALPGLLLRAPRGDWRAVTLWYGRALIAFALIFVAARLRDRDPDEPSSLLRALRANQLTIDRFVRAERAAAPGMFDQRLVRNHERALRESLPDGTVSGLSIDTVTDGSGWMRVHMKYQGVFRLRGESVTNTGQIVLYYHPGGLAVITAACTTAPRECSKIEAPLAAAEQALRARFAATDLDDVLPAAERCAVETVQGPSRDSTVRACLYEPGLQLTLTRFDAAATIQSLISERSPAR